MNRRASISLLSAPLLILTTTFVFGQQTSAAAPWQNPATNQSQQPPKPAGPPSTSSPSSGQVIFSRSEPAPDAPQTKPVNPAQNTNAPPPKSLVTDAERTALTFTSYDLDVHLEPAKQSISVRAHIVAQNDGDKPLNRIALQLSSPLHWYSIHVNGSAAKFETESIDSDIDHTGKLTEAVVNLPTPLNKAATLSLDVIYSGTIETSAARLLRLGAPASVAASSEWDRISPAFTALRGYGNVIWFPVSAAPVLLGEGPRMFDSIGQWKLRESNARIKMQVSVEYLADKPTVAFLNGYAVSPATSPKNPAPSPVSSDVLHVVSFNLAQTRLGFSPLSLFVTDATKVHSPGLEIYTRAGNDSASEPYQQAVAKDRALIEQWLGKEPKRPVILIDLPESDDLPFEERNILFLPLTQGAPDQIGPVMAHMLSHSYFVSPRPWLNEGVAQFMTLLWIERHFGHEAAITQMESKRGALALAETGDPAVDPGQSLIAAWSDIYYRDKAADVFWMLRDIAGDDPLAQTLASYRGAADTESGYLQRMLQQASHRDLEWFFDDWVYRDRGLPDLHIASAYSRPILTKNSTGRNHLVSVDVQNESYCSAEVAVTVESGLTSETRRLLVPSHTRAALRVLIDGEPGNATVNDGSVPEVRTSHHEEIIHPAEQPVH